MITEVCYDRVRWENRDDHWRRLRYRPRNGHSLCTGTCESLVGRSNYLKDCPDPAAEEKRIVSGIPLQRFAAPEDIAKAVRFLASSDASYITGTWLAVDGGLLARG
jgi:NAD(P)-dependent dehydrogenase (short-subunit alcohol dehydrogenase family)